MFAQTGIEANNLANYLWMMSPDHHTAWTNAVLPKDSEATTKRPKHDVQTMPGEI